MKSAQSIGFSLDEIAELLRLEDGTHCQEARGLAEHKLQDIRVKIDDLRRMEAALDALVGHCNAAQGTISCALISALHRE